MIMAEFYICICVALTVLTFACMGRAVVGPTAIDRVLSINIIGTKTIAIISVISFAFNETFFLDVAIVYALISFLMTIGVAKYLETGNLS